MLGAEADVLKLTNVFKFLQTDKGCPADKAELTREMVKLQMGLPSLQMALETYDEALGNLSKLVGLAHKKKRSYTERRARLLLVNLRVCFARGLFRCVLMNDKAGRQDAMQGAVKKAGENGGIKACLDNLERLGAGDEGIDRDIDQSVPLLMVRCAEALLYVIQYTNESCSTKKAGHEATKELFTLAHETLSKVEAGKSMYSNIACRVHVRLLASRMSNMKSLSELKLELRQLKGQAEALLQLVPVDQQREASGAIEKAKSGGYQETPATMAATDDILGLNEGVWTLSKRSAGCQWFCCSNAHLYMMNGSRADAPRVCYECGAAHEDTASR